MAARREPGWREIVPRLLAASIGAYALCYAWIGAAVRLLPMVIPIDGVDANILATCLAFILFVVAALRAFALRSTLRVWVELLTGTALPLCLLLGSSR